jgi:Zinc-binding dehydrogenase
MLGKGRRHVATRIGVGRPVNLAHPARADLAGDLIRTETAAWARDIGESNRDYRGMRPISRGESGKLRTVIGRRYSLDEIAEAHCYANTGHKIGDVAMQIGIS